MIIQTVTDSFLQELFQGIHDFSSDAFKIALYTAEADLGPATEAYTSSNETIGSGYTAGGLTLSSVSLLVQDGVSYVDFSDATWTTAVFTARGALIYNSSKANRSVAVLNFGDDKTATSTFTVQMPPATATTALLRISKGV